MSKKALTRLYIPAVQGLSGLTNISQTPIFTSVFSYHTLNSNQSCLVDAQITASNATLAQAAALALQTRALAKTATTPSTPTSVRAVAAVKDAIALLRTSIAAVLS
ncbi:hypothetical protein FRC05_009240 [Tulasnella sp. 425]|nr:hypothetical protein FRC05_009240 [Tulasnella sp. 425]